MSDNIILTPMQLWKDYDPHSEPLRPSYLKFDEKDTIYELEAYINGDSYDGENIRIYVQGFIPINSNINSNIIFVNDKSEKGGISQNQIQFSKEGFGVFTFDYYGHTFSSNKYTRYPKAISYANYTKAGDHINHATPTAKDTSIFIWDKVCMKVINLVKQLRGDDTQIILAGIQTGADIAWQVAAIDKRVDAIATTLNAGWKEYKDYPKLADIEMPLDDERKRWFTGSATATYLKFIKCPVLCMNSTNGSLTPLDRIQDTMQQLKENKAKTNLYVAAGLSDTINSSTKNTLLYWAKCLATKKKMEKDPTMTLIKNKDGRLIATVKADKSSEIEKITVHYSYDELNPMLRSWLSQPISLQDLYTDIPVYNETQLVFAYATVVYKSGYSLSSIQEYMYTPQNEDFIRVNIPRSRIIYQKNFGTKGWIVEQAKTVLDFLEVKQEEGPLKIAGITSPVGDLSTYTIGDYKYKSDAQNILQFDAVATQDRKLTVGIIAGTPGKYDSYFATLSLKANKWTKCSLKISDFKTSGYVPLREWGNIKKLTFKNIDSTLISNIIWV